MSDYATKNDVQVIVNKAVDDLSDVITNLAQGMHKGLEEVKSDLDKKANQDSIDKLANTIDGFVKRLDDMETDDAARDAQYQRLLQWAREVSKKTGIPLKNL